MDPTIDYYNLNAENFIENTQNVDMHLAQDKFLHLLNEGAAILDFGCGSGRDARYFLSKGYQVTATDGSAEICRLASEFTGIEVKHLLFQELGEINSYMVYGPVHPYCICPKTTYYRLYERCVWH